VQREHLKVKPYKCEFCDMKYFSRDGLKLHKTKRHGI
jgi:hypothetical protein